MVLCSEVAIIIQQIIGNNLIQITQQTFTCSKSATETLERGVKYGQS